VSEFREFRGRHSDRDRVDLPPQVAREEQPAAPPGLLPEWSQAGQAGLEGLAVVLLPSAALAADGLRSAPRQEVARQQHPHPEAPGAAGAWHAVAGFQVQVCPAQAPPTFLWGRQVHVLAYLLALPADLEWSVQLRILASPGGHLRLALLCAARAETAARAERAVREVAAAVSLASDFLAPVYELVPVTEEETLLPLLALPALEREGDIVEIGPRTEEWRSLEGEVLALPLFLSPHPGMGQWLCHALVREAVQRQCTLLWAVTVESAWETGVSLQRLRAELAQAQAEFRATLQAAPLADTAGSVGLLERAQEVGQAGAALEQCFHRLQGLVGKVQAFLVADRGQVPPSVVAAALAGCSHDGTVTAQGPVQSAAWWRPVRPRELSWARHALAWLRCVDWQAAYRAVFAHPGGEGEGSLARRRAEPPPAYRLLADLRQIAALFQLPLPGAAGLPGLRVPPQPREAWLLFPPRPAGPAVVLGENCYRRYRQPIALGQEDRRRHVYCVGQTGTGKSTLLLNLILQDLEAGRGVAVLDPHGQLVESVLGLLPAHRRADVVLLDPSDRQFPVGFNFLECESAEEQDQVVESFIGMLYQLFDPFHTGIIGPRFEHAARNAMRTVMSHPGMTLIEVVRVLTDPSFVRELLPRVNDPLVKRYWTDQIAQTSDFHRSEVLDYIVSKFSPFVHNRLVRNIIGQSKSAFHLRQLMEEQQVLLVNLAQGLLGQKLSTFLGMVLVPRLLAAAFSRVDTPEKQRPDFYLYVDEFQHYATPAFVDILSGARKYRLNIVMAHQHTAQLPDDVRAAIFGNVGTFVAFRVGLPDAQLLAAAMQPSPFATGDYLELPNFRAIAQVLQEGRRSEAFSLATGPAPDPSPEQAGRVREEARRRYGRPRTEVEAEIAERARL
jgi:hypothetical protein